MYPGSTLRYAAYRHGESQLELLADLIGKERAKPEVVGAVSFIVFGLAILMTFGWCWWSLPRAPQTFNTNPTDLMKEYCRVLRHYVRWSGGLDFAILCLALEQEVEFDAEDCGHHPSRQNVRQGQQTTYITHLLPGHAWPRLASR